MTGRIVDLFAGPGGWSVGLNMLGLEDIGIEWERDACLTRKAAGHLTVRADVSQYPPEAFGKVWGLIASPPCPDFSTAGSGKGRAGKSGWLIDTVPAWVCATQPEWIACEQVPPALPVWKEHADLYRQMGYSVWCGVLCAADYGVPQTRRRAFLIASRERAAVPPEPTHAEEPGDGLFGHVAPWVSMRRAVGWESVDRRQRRRPIVPGTEPAPTLTSTAPGGQWVAMSSGTRVRLTPPSCSVIQSFPADYPWQGDWKTQVGNAVPPLMAAHVLSAVTGRAIRSEPEAVAS